MTGQPGGPGADGGPVLPDATAHGGLRWSAGASVRRALLVWLLLPLGVLIPLAAALIYALALESALDALDRALTDTAVALGEILEVREGRATLPISDQTARALSADLVDETAFAVRDAEGRLLGGSASLLRLAPVLRSGEWRFFDGTLEGKPVRVAALGVACGARPADACAIAVSETLGKRTAAERAALLAAVLAAAGLALPLVLLAMVAVRRALRPLQRAAAEVEALMPHRLEAVDDRGMPAEAAGFVHAVNGLLARLKSAGAAQRAFIADAAHQLRTPLAVMRVEAAQVLAAPHPPELHRALERLHAGAERGARLAQQLLSLARAEGAMLDPGQPAERLDLASLATRLADRWIQPSLAAGQDLGFDLAPAVVWGFPLLLEEALGNLVDNATAYAGPGARVTVGTRTTPQGAELTVEDDGPGVPADEREGLWQRFRRGRDAAGVGSGLGLAIVADIARLHGATAALEPGPGGRGLRVRLTFPAAAAGLAGGAGEPGTAPDHSS